MLDILWKIWRTGIMTKKDSVKVVSPYEACNKRQYDTMGHITNPDDLGQELERKIKKVLGKSLHIRHVDSGSCNGCDFEMTMLMNPFYDIGRFGIDFVASPRHADMLMVTGGVTRHLEEALRKTYEAVANPKMVVAIGDCACGESIFGETYAHLDGVNKIVPVFVNVPGCPPHPQAMIEAIFLALDQFETRRGIHES